MGNKPQKLKKSNKEVKSLMEATKCECCCFVVLCPPITLWIRASVSFLTQRSDLPPPNSFPCSCYLPFLFPLSLSCASVTLDELTALHSQFLGIRGGADDTKGDPMINRKYVHTFLRVLALLLPGTFVSCLFIRAHTFPLVLLLLPSESFKSR